MTTMLDFYRQHQISPVKQEIGDLQAHFQRRAGLYRALGLPPVAITGKSVLEVGPGSGDNAVYAFSLKPNRYEMVEPNLTGFKHLKQACWREDRPSYWDVESSGIHCCELKDYWANIQFDVVLCEGLLGLCGYDPKSLVEQLKKHVSRGGVLVITTIDPISDLAEVIRRAMAHRLVDRSKSLQEQANQLSPVFAPHLATLKGMTRTAHDWIIDNLLNPASIGPTFSIPDACAALDGKFEILGSSPRWLVNWDWYKEAPTGTAWVQHAYWEQAHNLIDYRTTTAARPNWENRHLMRTCERVRVCVRELEQEPADASTAELVMALKELTGLPRVTMDAIRSAIQWLSVPADAHALAENKEFGAWFGRGQQYLSWVRVA